MLRGHGYDWLLPSSGGQTFSHPATSTAFYCPCGGPSETEQLLFRWWPTNEVTLYLVSGLYAEFVEVPRVERFQRAEVWLRCFSMPTTGQPLGRGHQITPQQFCRFPYPSIPYMFGSSVHNTAMTCHVRFRSFPSFSSCHFPFNSFPDIGATSWSGVLQYRAPGPETNFTGLPRTDR